MGHVRGAEVERSFPASDYGKRVGWVRVKEREDTPFVAIDVVTAEVTGPEGAEFGSQFWKDDETDTQVSERYPYARGFGRVAAFSALITREGDPREEHSLAYTAEGMTYPSYRPTAEDLLGRGTGDNRDVEAAEKVWASEPSELLETMRDIFTKLDFESAYKTMYYLINGSIAQDGRMTSELSHVDPWTLLMPDPVMKHITRQQLEHMQAMSSAYTESVTNDMNMRHRIVGFIDDTPKKDIPDRFIKSRETAAALEKRVGEAASKLIVSRLAYVPTGHGRAGRTWPYMDATASDPDKAYGLELNDLRARSINRALGELDNEIKELDARHELTREAIQRLELLSELENA